MNNTMLWLAPLEKRNKSLSIDSSSKASFYAVKAPKSDIWNCSVWFIQNRGPGVFLYVYVWMQKLTILTDPLVLAFWNSHGVWKDMTHKHSMISLKLFSTYFWTVWKNIRPAVKMHMVVVISYAWLMGSRGFGWIMDTKCTKLLRLCITLGRLEFG